MSIVITSLFVLCPTFQFPSILVVRFTFCAKSGTVTIEKSEISSPVLLLNFNVILSGPMGEICHNMFVKKFTK